MSSGDKNNIYMMQLKLNEVIKDINLKVKAVLDKYKDGIPKLPDYNEIKKVNKFYDVYNKHLNIQDEIIDIMVRLDLVLNQLDEILETKLTRDISNDFSELMSFRNHIERSMNRLKSYRYDLIEIKRNNNDRIKLLQGLLFRFNGTKNL